MPTDSQAITRLYEARAAATARLQRVEEKLAAAESAVTRYTTSKATIEDEIADIDESITATEALP